MPRDALFRCVKAGGEEELVAIPGTELGYVILTPPTKEESLRRRLWFGGSTTYELYARVLQALKAHQQGWLQSDRPVFTRAVDEVFDVSASAHADGLSEEMLETFSRSRELLSLPENWDSEGAAPISASTHDRAIALVKTIAAKHFNIAQAALPVPRVGPALDSSIDLFWKLSHSSLLLNVPHDPSEAATYYGRRQNGTYISGSIVPNDPGSLYIAAWIADRA